MTQLVVSEVFGPTFQGEGPSLGRRAGFVRLGRCNLACSFCDTPYTWDWERHDPAEELTRVDVSELAERVRSMSVPLVVITGGEPLLQQSHLIGFLAELHPCHEIEIETAGTLAPHADLIPLVSRFNVSPKLSNSGMPADRRYKPEVLRSFQSTGKAAFKFVVTDEASLDEVATMVEECGLHDVWVMPEGVTAEDVTGRSRAIAEAVLARRWNLTTRLHVLLWGDERGR